MRRALLGLAVLALLVVLVPYGVLTGTGLYYGRDVPSGIKMFTLGLFGKSFMVSETPVAMAEDLPVPKRSVIWMGKLVSEHLPETSGLAASPDHSNLLYAVNDSGNAPEIRAITLDGKDAAGWPIEYPGLHDFEDLASFEMNGKPYLLVADTGDNLHWRPALTILVFEAPDASTAGRPTVLAWQFNFSFPGGARDVESVAVDAESDSIFLITKRQVPPELFRLPLQPDHGYAEAELITRLTGIPAPTEDDLREDPEYGEFSSLPTAFDMCGDYAVVVTYKEAYLYRRKTDSPWGESFSGLPDRIPLPDMYGLESVAFSSDGRYFFVTGEREKGVGPADVFRVEVR